MNSVRSLTQAYSQAPWRKQMKFIVLSLLAVVFVALVAGVYLSVTARAATIGREILTMQAQIDQVQLTNADLQNQLAMITSMSMMEKRAKELGFEPIEKGQQVYIVVPGYIPRQKVNLAPPPAPLTPVAASLPSDYTESLLDWLRQHLLSSRRTLEK